MNYFNEFGLNEYVNFLRDKKDMRNSTIGKQMGFLKWFLRWSFKKGLSPEHSIRYVQTETENHPQEGNLPDMGRTEQSLKTTRYPRTSSTWNVSGMFSCSAALPVCGIRMFAT